MSKKSSNLEEDKILNKRGFIKNIFNALLILTIIWAGITVYEYSRVINNKDTIICFNKVKQIEDEDEYSVTCVGLLYKYRKYYYKESGKVSARSFTMVTNNFERES